MAAHHHCHHQHQQQSHHHHESTCFSCCSSTCPPPYPPPQPHLSPTDPLLQAIASQLLHQQSQQQQSLFTQYVHKPSPQPQKHHQKQEQQQQTQALLTSLVRRINALESSLSLPNISHSRTSNLRDIAARTIQTHFRAYLVRRSQTLRHLKHLANIKSSFKTLKSCVSSNPHFNSQSLSQKAMGLLHKLDFVQGGDPMIRDGKRTISRELVQFMEFLDGVSLKRHQLYSKSMRKVRFAEDNIGSHEPCACEDVEVLEDEGVSNEEQRELMENLCKKIENIEGLSRVYEDDNDEEETSRNPRSNLQSDKGQKGNPYFSAPVPVQMEPELMKREKVVRVAR